MRIKKFTGSNLAQVTAKMKEELGPEAIVLNTRKISKSGKLSFGGKDEFEITAAIDSRVESTNRPASRKPIDPDALAHLQSPSSNRHGDREDRNGDTFSGLKTLAAHLQQRNSPVEAATPARDNVSWLAEFHQMKGEMEDIKAALREINRHLKYSRMPSLPDVLKAAYVRLLNQDVHEELAADLVQAVYGKLSEEQFDDERFVEQQLIHLVAGLFVTDGRLKSGSRKCTTVALVGPTGVGKTTTIAKLAAINKLVDHRDVGLISVDTYRIGAIEQLRTFAAIADIPMEVVYKPSEMESALRKFRSKDIVFVDTVGRNQRGKKELAELNRFVMAARPAEIQLVLNAAASERTTFEVLEKFGTLKPGKLVFSKIDEAASLGLLLNVVRKHRLPISYITTGQTVPDDIMPADSRKIATMICSGGNGNA